MECIDDNVRMRQYQYNYNPLKRIITAARLRVLLLCSGVKGHTVGHYHHCHHYHHYHRIYINLARLFVPHKKTSALIRAGLGWKHQAKLILIKILSDTDQLSTPHSYSATDKPDWLTVNQFSVISAGKVVLTRGRAGGFVLYHRPGDSQGQSMSSKIPGNIPPPLWHLLSYNQNNIRYLLRS